MEALKFAGGNRGARQEGRQLGKQRLEGEA
jgi:hypothetical protein